MAVSRRLRFEILRRDNHACRYCGATAPDARLTVDHVVPVTLGGGDDPTNLVAACMDCNGGKSSVPPDAPLVADIRDDAMRWRHAMLHAFRIAQAEREERNQIRQEFLDCWNGWTVGIPDGERETLPLPLDWSDAIDRFTSAGLDPKDLVDAVDVAMRQTTVMPDNKFRYFCGVCWRMLDDRQHMARGLLDAEEVGGVEGGA